MSNSPRMRWPVPNEISSFWFDDFTSLTDQQDASAYAAREDRGLVMASTAKFLFTAGSDSLEWDDDFDILSPISGFRMTLEADTVTIPDGYCMYVDLTRAPTDNLVVEPLVEAQLPSSDVAYVLCVRRGTNLWWRHGKVLPTGSLQDLFSGRDAGVQFTLWMGGRESHNSDTIAMVCGAIAFNPADHDPISEIRFRAVAANNGASLTNYVQLWNVTDNEMVVQLEVTSTETTKDEVVLVRGSGVGEIDDLERIYEVRLLMGAPPAGEESVELYSAELRVYY